MNTLEAEKRDLQIKAKKLRREGYVTGNIFGREMKESMPIKIEKAKAEQLMKNNGRGSQVMLDVEGQKIDALIKDVTYDPLKHQFMEIDFQALVQGEKVHSVAEIVLLNTDVVTAGIVEPHLHEISFKATPDALIDKIEVDVSHMKVGDTIEVKDLDIASNKNIDLLTNSEEVIVTIGEIQAPEDDEEEAAEA